MSLCKQVRAPARGGGLLGRPRLRVPLNGCRKTKPFQSVPWKRQTTVRGMVERQSKLHLTDRELWFELSYWPEKKDSENMCCWQRRGQTTSDNLWWKGKYAFPECFRLWLFIVLSRTYVFVFFFIKQYSIVQYNLPHGQGHSSFHVIHSLLLITVDSKHAGIQQS